MEMKWKAISWPDYKEPRSAKPAPQSDGQIWVYDSDYRKAAPSTSRREVVASVQMPLPYSNYCPTALFATAPSDSPSPPPLSTLPDFPLDLEMSSMTQDFPPFQPHVFSFGGLTHSPPAPSTASTSKSASLPPLPSHNRPNARHANAIPDHLATQDGPSSDREQRQTISSASMPPPFAQANSDTRRSSLSSTHAPPSFQDYRMDGPSAFGSSPLAFPSQQSKDGRPLPSIAPLLQTTDPLEGLAAPTAFYDNRLPSLGTTAAAPTEFGSRRDSLGGGKRAESFEAARRESAGTRE